MLNPAGDASSIERILLGRIIECRRAALILKQTWRWLPGVLEKPEKDERQRGAAPVGVPSEA